MDLKRKPELHIVGMDRNTNFKTLSDLYSGRDMSITCHSADSNGIIDKREMVFMMRTAEIVFVLVGNKREYKKLRSIVHRMPEKCIFVFEAFQGRERCLCRGHKSLLIKGRNTVIDVVGELISIAMYDSTMMLDYQDFLACSGWKTVVNYRRYVNGDEAIADMEIEAARMRLDEKREVSLLFAEGDFALSELVEIVKKIEGDGDDNPLVGCSYEEDKGLGLLWFVRDKNELTEKDVIWQNPFKINPSKWFKIGFFVMTFLCIVLGIKLLTTASTEQEEDALLERGKAGVLILSVKSAMPDQYGLGIVSCHKDVVKLYGEEYEKVAETVEKEFSVSGMSEELEMLSLFGRASSFSELTCKRMNGEVISFLREGEYHVDGAAGIVKEGHTYSVKTGKKLTMDDVIVEDMKDEFYQVIGQYIVEELDCHPDVIDFHVNAEEEYWDNYGKYGEVSSSWFFNEEGMGFLFEEGDFGPMCVKPIEIKVPYSKLRPYIRKEYQ